MTRLTLLRGVSGSGKSTWARANKGSGVIVSRDLLRPLITGQPGKTVLDREGEALVTKMETDLIVRAFKSGRDVIVDNTNLTPTYARRYLDLAVRHGVETRVVDFKVTLDEALSRSDIPESAIRRQFAQAKFQRLEPTLPVEAFQPYNPPKYGPPAFVFDIDGTLAHMNGRSPYDPTKYHTDTVDESLTWVAESLCRSHYVLIFTGRDETYRPQTEAWLRENGVEYDELHMRPAGDIRDDAVVKSEMLDAVRYRVIGVFDDRDRVVSMWRRRGVPCYQVAEGDF